MDVRQASADSWNSHQFCFSPRSDRKHHPRVEIRTLRSSGRFVHPVVRNFCQNVGRSARSPRCPYVDYAVLGDPERNPSQGDEERIQMTLLGSSVRSLGFDRHRAASYLGHRFASLVGRDRQGEVIDRVQRRQLTKHRRDQLYSSLNLPLTLPHFLYGRWLASQYS